MRDTYLLKALLDRKKYNTLHLSIPKGAFAPNTYRMIQWLGKYYDVFPNHNSVDLPALENLILMSGKLDADQTAITKREIQLMSRDVADDIIQATVDTLTELKVEEDMKMLLRKYENGEEIDLISEASTLLQVAKHKRDTQDNAQWCDADIWELMQEDADDSGYKLKCLPENIWQNLKGLTSGHNVCLAAPTDKGKTSLLCRIASTLAIQHKEYVEAGAEFRPVLYLVNEGLAKRITPRIYQTVIGLKRKDLYALGAKGGADAIIKEYERVLGRKDAIRLVDIHGFTVGQVARLIEKHNPFCVITDMTGRIRAPSSQGANDTAQLEIVWDSMRQLAAIHDFIHIGTAQISVEGMDNLYPPLTALQNSKTGIQTTLDLAIWMGAWLQPNDPRDLDIRGIYTPKNKLPVVDAKDKLNKAQFYVDFELNKWDGS